MRCEGESGQSLVIIVIAMFAILAISALAIDAAGWYQKHHQEQVAADAAALAAANCLANGSATSTGSNMCSSATDTTKATSVGTGVAATNAAEHASITYGTSTSGVVTNVTVTTSAPAPSWFSRIAGISPRASATAVASVTYSLGNCATSGSGCLMFYAATSDCSNPGITIQVGNSVNLNGGILTNSYVDDSKGNGGNFTGYISYGTGSTCASNESTKSNGTYVHAPSQQSSDLGSSTTPNWPIDYSQDFPACSGAGAAPTNCSGSGTPNYCTYSNFSTSTWTTSGDGVYCDVGTGTPGNPATWNGVLHAGTSNASVTMIAGQVSINGVTETAYSHNLIAYATGSGSATSSNPAFSAKNGTTTWTGDIFAPNGGVSITGGNIAFDGFIQAQTINYGGGASTGDGPTYTGGSTFVGQDTLSQ